MASLAPSWAENLKGADQVQPFSHAARPSLLPYANARQHITSEPVRLRQPSILDLLTALPLLLALDDRDYIDTLNGALERRAASAQQQQQRRKAAVHHASPSACLSDDEDPCDAATTAVVAVLRGGGGGGSAAWQTQRRRLRRAALDAFFQATLPTPLSTRGADGAASSGGIHGATLRLLAHTRAVLSDVSPTQAHLMDLFASRLLGSKLDTKSARAVNSSVGGDEEDIASYAEEGERKNSAVFLAGGENAASASLSSAAAPPMPRSIMKPSAPHVAPSAERKSAPTASPSSVSIAEQLLYIVLRTSIAANTPRRAEVQDSARRTATVAAAERSSSLYTPPGLSSDAHRSSSPTTTASSSGSAVHKKPRADLQQTTSANTEDEADGPSALFSDREGDSIRHHPMRGGLVLPYEPQCWLGPTTVSQVENSAVLRRQQRWTCDGDPVIEATIAGDGQETYDSAVTAAAAAAADEGGFASGVQQRRLTGRRRHWTAASERDGAALRTLVRDSALPFFTATREADTPSVNEAAPAFHWDFSVTDEEKAVDVLFTARVSSETEASTQAPLPHALPTASAAAAAEDAKSVSDREAPSSPSLPLCRTPFVSCNAVYDPVLYARVFVALHRCTAGLIDPFELTLYDCRGGPNAVEIRVRPEFYTPTAAQVRSGLTAMLEQGCRCGTLLLRLHRLCAVAEEATLRASLGSYGRSAMDTLRLVLCLLQRQVWELGDREGGTHRLSFTELLTAQQRLQIAAEQVEALAVFFAVPAASVPAAPTRSARTPTAAQAKISPQLWDPVAVLQGSCCSALLLSRLHQFFTTRHANALGRHGSAFAAGASASNGADEEEEEELRRAAFLEGMGEGRDTATRRRQSPSENDDAAARLRRRKELLSRAIDGIGLLLRATLRPLNTMLHRWLTAGELADPYDEFFVVPSHGSTHSGFTLDLSPQRLPVFVSAAAASDLLHAGVSLRVLRGAATHVVHSAQKDTRRLLALAELTEAAADEYAEELQDTQTLRTAIEAFIERLVRGAPTVSAAHAMGSCQTRQTESLPLLPLPPRVDVLAACGAPQWWRQHYHACTQLLLEAVEQPAFAATTEGEEHEEKRSKAHDATEATPTAVADGYEEVPPSEEPQGSSKTASTTTTITAAAAAARASEPLNEEAQQTVVAAEEAFQPSDSSSASHTAATTAAAAATTHLTYPLGIALTPAEGAQTQRGEHHGETQRRDHRNEGDEEEEQRYITVFMNSDEDDEVADNIVSADKTRPTASPQQRQQHGEETTSARSSRSSSSSPSAAAASSTATSVLGLRRIAGSAFSTSSTLSSTASSRGTIALYGAITEELRQVSMMEQQTEARAGQSRHALRAEFTAQMLRRRREMRLVDWKAQRLALRLRRVRAMSGVVDELREVYGIRGVGYVMAEAPTVDSEGHEHNVQGAATRFVVPLTQLPPPRAQPPVVLYADVRGGEAEREGRQPRRTSFAATVSTVVQPALRRPSSPTAGSLLMPPRHRRTQSLGGQSQQSGPHDEENPLSTGTRVTQQSTKMATREQRSASFSTSVSSGVATQRVHVDVCVPQLAPPSPTALSLSASASGGSPRSVRHLSDVAAGSWSGPGAAGLEGSRSGATTLLRNEREMAVEAAHTACVGQALVDEEASAAAAAAVAAEASGLQYDELGYAHHAAHYVVADINDDEFLFARTGPKSYARREAEVAALTQLAEGRARLDACTVDTPAFLRQLADAAHSLLLRESTECGENAAATAVTAEEEEDEEREGERTATAASRCASGLQPAALSTAWRMDDPLDHPHRHAFAGTPTSTDAEGEEKMDRTSQLWSWTPAEAHRWYFDGHLPFHHALTSDAAVDRALLLHVPLRASEAEALQSCGVYYRALGQYTAGFLTHKALQLTLLPPYGSLHRLTTQFLDVCLLQRASSAVRIVDVWIAAVDTALEMMTEQEEAAMVSAAVAGITDVPLALASLTGAQHGLDLAAALTALNGVFQSEWAACVAGGDATVTLAWTLGTASDTSLSTHQHQPRQQQQSRGNKDEEEGKDNLALLNDSDDADSSSDGESHTRDEQQQHHANTVESKKDDATSQRARVDKRRAASPIQSFLAALRLTAVSPWCSGAWLLPERTTRSLGGIFAALLFWKSVERVVLHTWRAGMASGLSSVFFFCTTVRQVLLSTLHEPLWGRLTELAAAYRGSLLFEAGVLYSYRSLESFTADHERFLEECEFYSLCAPPFQRRVRPLLWAMMREVEVAEQAVRFAQVATRVARRQYMTTFHSMVSGGSSSSSDEDDHSEEVRRGGSSRGARATLRSGASSVHQGKPTTVVPPSTAAAQPSAAAAAAGASATHVFTPSRWSRRRLRDAGSGGALRSGSAASSSPPSLRRPHTPWYMRPIEAALAEQHQPQQRTAPSTTTTSIAANQQSDTRSASALSSTTAATTTNATTASASRARTVDGDGEEGSGEEDEGASACSRDSAEEEGEGSTPQVRHGEDSADPAEAAKKKKRKKKRRRPQQTSTATKGPPRRSIMESARMNTTPIYATLLANQTAQQQQQQRHRDHLAAPQLPPPAPTHKRSRSGGVSHRSAAAPSTAAVITYGPLHLSSSSSSLPPQRRPRRGRGDAQGPRLTPEERQERRAKLRVIAERKIQEATEHQRRRVRDVVARRLRRFASLTVALRDALSDVIAEEDVSAQGAMGTNGALRGGGGATSTAAAAKELHDAQRQQMNRFAYLSAMVRRLDSLIAVMASQV